VDPIPRKHTITTADTAELTRRFLRLLDEHPDMPPVRSLDVNTERSMVRFAPGTNYTGSGARNVATWAVEFHAPLTISLSSTYTVSTTARITAADGEVFDIEPTVYLSPGVGRLLAWLVKSREHSSGGACPHCGHGGEVTLAAIPDGGTFECSAAAFCIAWDNAYAEYLRMPTRGPWISVEQALVEDNRSALLRALFQDVRHDAPLARK
jgi:hypothetical protein